MLNCIQEAIFELTKSRDEFSFVHTTSIPFQAMKYRLTNFTPLLSTVVFDWRKKGMSFVVNIHDFKIQKAELKDNRYWNIYESELSSAHVHTQSTSHCCSTWPSNYSFLTLTNSFPNFKQRSEMNSWLGRICYKYSRVKFFRVLVERRGLIQGRHTCKGDMTNMHVPSMQQETRNKVLTMAVNFFICIILRGITPSFPP